MNYRQVSRQYVSKEDVIELSKKEEMALRKVLLSYLARMEYTEDMEDVPLMSIELNNKDNAGHIFHVVIRK